jgi:PI-3-kinase-related kinase SMG-1
MLQADPSASARGLALVRCYSVTPLGPRAGLIQWVPATISLFAVFREWQAATLERHEAMVAARQEGVAKAMVDGAPLPPEVEPPPVAAVTRPMDLFYSKLVAALQVKSGWQPHAAWRNAQSL